MPYNIIVTPIAINHIEKAMEYYMSNANRKVADNLLKQILDAFKILEVNPYFQIKVKSYRAFVLKKYPYILFFEIMEGTQTIKILALFHTSQNHEKYP